MLPPIGFVESFAKLIPSLRNLNCAGGTISEEGEMITLFCLAVNDALTGLQRLDW